uniref:PiggyBac transposable element-derived protein domain-containing protein n=1 Tax=Timema monikensis TaxID=170555 RepID=A0A7R9EEG3_9NEOP|nr:unnamed protein product [Timema monikensis]
MQIYQLMKQWCHISRHGAKQHMHGKPIRFGYKVWCLCSRLGYLVQGEPYQGASTRNTHPELGVGGSVVIDLDDKLPHGQYSIYIDNFFTSVRLQEELKSKGHYCTGTIRSNRIEKASLEEASTLKKRVRGSYSQLTDTDSGITLIRYHDNIVTVASTLRGAKPIGVDRLDQNISTYRVNVHMKKWYWQMIMFPLDAFVNNAWQLYRLTSKGKEDKQDLLVFTRFIVQTYISKYSIGVAPGPSPKRLKKLVCDDIRLDGLNYVIVKSLTQIRCGECHKNTTMKCKKCNVGCHVYCSEMFHSR